MFYVGQKVCCLDSKADDGGFWEYAPVLGEIYTVVDCVYEPLAQFEVVLLAEIKNTDWCSGRYRASRFRPVVERKTSIEIFRAMLNPSKQGADA
jgi:hypothetical protein